jgi:hypothetical protein
MAVFTRPVAVAGAILDLTAGDSAAVVQKAEVDATTRLDSGEAVKPERWCWWSTGILIVGGVAIGAYAHDHWATSVTFTHPEGIGIFALFYILAQTIERIQEPVASMVKGKETVETGAATSVNKTKAKASMERSVAASLNDPADGDLAKAAANAKRAVDQVRTNTTLLLFGTGAFLGMLGAGILKCLLLVTVGVTGLPIWLDVAVTGLAVGGGTKPLHDLIANIEKAKEAKDDKQATGTP